MMGAMSPSLHVVTAAAAGIDELWDLCDEMAVRLTGDEKSGVTVHSLGHRSGDTGPRYCVHPHSDQRVEFRAAELKDALLMGASWLASQFPEDEMWRRG